MRVRLDFTPAIQADTGISRYARELTRHLMAHHRDLDLSLFYVDSANRPPSPFDTLSRQVIHSSAKPWRLRVLLNSFLHRPMNHIIGETDLFHATYHLLPPLKNIKSVFTLYDLTTVKYPEVHLPLNRWFSRLMLPRFLRQADKILAISECTRQDALNLYNLPSSKIVTIPLGISLNPQIISAELTHQIRLKYNLPTQYLLYVGTIEPRKNLSLLFSALKEANLPQVKLVVVGKKGWLYDQTFKQLQELGLESQVIFTGFVPDKELMPIYKLADAFVFPSLYEGFGLSILEAMACGTAVICSNNSSLPEVAGDAAMLVPPNDIRGWVQAITQVTQNESLRAQLREQGLRQVTHFSWATTAQQTYQVYQEIYASRW